MSPSPKTLTADAILAKSPRTKVVSIPALGGKIKVREYLVGDQMWIAEKLVGRDDESGFESLVWQMIRCTVEPELTEDQFESLKNLPTAALIQVSNAVAEAGGEAVSVDAAQKSADTQA